MAETQAGLVFWALAAVAVVSAFMVVSLRNVFHCALFLIMSLFAVAGIFVLLDAEFLAAAPVLIYVGAVAILMVFAVMLTSRLSSKSISQTNENALVGFFVAVIFFMSVLFMLANTSVWNYARTPIEGDNTMTLGRTLMTEYVLPFEVVSVLLLAAMIGAIVLARKESA